MIFRCGLKFLEVAVQAMQEGLLERDVEVGLICSPSPFMPMQGKNRLFLQSQHVWTFFLNSCDCVSCGLARQTRDDGMAGVVGGWAECWEGGKH